MVPKEKDIDAFEQKICNVTAFIIYIYRKKNHHLVTWDQSIVLI